MRVAALQVERQQRFGLREVHYGAAPRWGHLRELGAVAESAVVLVRAVLPRCGATAC